MSKSSLATYREKRRSERTPEPFGGSPGTGAGAFCVQKHAARRAGVHMDLRLELAGVLKSWAVPKGISPDPADKRYAHETEDHPIEYVDFEGVIPEGEYGGGEMILWDIGRWVPLEDPTEGMVSGKLLFELRGHKLRGVWTLVRLAKSDTGKDWLLIRERRSGHPVLAPNELPDASILSGLTVEELARREGGWDPGASFPDRLEAAGAELRRVEPASVKPMLAREGEAAFDDPDWSFELKLDGYRVLASVTAEEPLLLTRNGNDITPSFPEIARALGAWPFEHVVLDGEVVVHDRAGLPSFQRLQKRARLSRPLDVRRASFEAPASFYAFDLLGFGDFDLRGLPLVERKRFLRELVPPAGSIRHSEHFPEAGTALFARVEELGLEGIMAKRSASAYVGERSADWLKIHAARRDRFVVVGFTRPAGSRAGFGALHLAYFDGEPGTHDRELVYTGRVGSGFDEATLRTLRESLDERVRDQLPMSGPVPTGDEHVWVEPELVARVRYKEITDEGLLRQPVFEDLEDVPPGDCIPPSGTRAALDEPVEVETGAPPVDEIPLSNLDKPFWPEEGYTKGDLIDYYRAIAPWLLPWLADRPLVLTRYPDGIRGKSFFQKNAPGFQPDWIRTETIRSEGSERDTEYFVADSAAALVFLANLGTIPLHVWASRIGSLHRPDWCLLDLDPKHRVDGEEVYAPFEDVISVARAIHGLCEEIGLPSYPKTSGSSGIHVLIPLGRQLDYEQSRSLASLMAKTVASDVPEVATTVRSPSKREGRVYIDDVQNGPGRLVVAPYSVRPRPGATVSAPLGWREVKPGLSMEKFTIRSMPRRVRAMTSDPLLPLLDETPDLMQALERLQSRLAE